MMPALFEMFLSGAVGWGVGRALDVLTCCSSCREKNGTRIGNAQFNDLECKNCHKNISQFTNCCQTTFDTSTNQIGHGLLWTRDAQWELECRIEPQGFWESTFGGGVKIQDHIKILYGVRLNGLKNRSVVVKRVLTCYKHGCPVFSEDLLCTVQTSDILFADSVWRVHRDRILYKKDHGDIFACDIYLESEFGDSLFQKRILIQPPREMNVPYRSR